MGFKAVKDWSFDDISWGRVAAGTGVGLVAVACAPFTGGGSILGATTLWASMTAASAAAGAIGGAAAGSCFQDEPDKEQADKADLADKLKRAEDALAKGKERFRSYAQFELICIALFTLAVAAAAKVGRLQESEANLRNIIFGISANAIPTELKAQIDQVWCQPIGLDQALDDLKSKVSVGDWHVVSSLIELLALIDIDVKGDYDLWASKGQEAA
ncbi:MAG: hypothetical protein Q7T36_16170 [Fluviicoccus sp.]|uniref:hypothetical protein n=1 Tax=Fluviicoccus sp. TaxID=2003552 RepID=UPI002720B85B|nr:hypothetical protein [Fluviicoccus sp.]MDO8332002.1 hypothetical protein [Fluviicoccus sp.]